jgi:uncharacterized membrane protein YbhN (UPF0104 family)
MLKGAFILGVLISIVIVLIVFIALRGFMLWYWKINDVISKLDLISTELKKLNQKT